MLSWGNTDDELVELIELIICLHFFKLFTTGDDIHNSTHRNSSKHRPLVNFYTEDENEVFVSFHILRISENSAFIKYLRKTSTKNTSEIHLTSIPCILSKTVEN